MSMQNPHIHRSMKFITLFARRVPVFCAGHSTRCFGDGAALVDNQIFRHSNKLRSRKLLMRMVNFDVIQGCTSQQCRQFHVSPKTCSSSETESKTKVELVYTAPLKGAVRAVKMFSLSTAVLTFIGVPVLVFWGKASVPLVARVFMSSILMLTGLGTTALLHWIVKGYVIRMEVDRVKENIIVHTLSLLALKKTREFHISDAKPPSKFLAFSTFEAHGKNYFMHTEKFDDKDLLNRLLGAYSAFEDPSVWEAKKN